LVAVALGSLLPKGVVVGAISRKWHRLVVLEMGWIVIAKTSLTERVLDSSHVTPVVMLRGVARKHVGLSTVVLYSGISLILDLFKSGAVVVAVAASSRGKVMVGGLGIIVPSGKVVVSMLALIWTVAIMFVMPIGGCTSSGSSGHTQCGVPLMMVVVFISNLLRPVVMSTSV